MGFSPQEGDDFYINLEEQVMTGAMAGVVKRSFEVKLVYLLRGCFVHFHRPVYK